ncbi:LysR family transcriptional regulator [Roseibium sp.]|uniref:LysR family transcriptional regulator n=1 Tax=Roseibium sp. TaxID=1936156 RepID=UPI003B5076F4
MASADIPLSVARALALVRSLGSVSEAARILGVSQPAVSKGIAQLEHNLGTQLLRRGNRPLGLTEEGGAVADYAHRADLLHDQLLARLEDARSNRTGTVRLGSFGSSASFQILPRTLSDFARASPGIRVEILEFPDEELEEALEDGIVDLAIMSLTDADTLEIASVASDRLVGLVSDGHPLAGRERVTPEEMAGYPFILTKGGSGPLVERWFAAAGVSPKVTHTILQVNSILALVEAGLGISIIAEMALPKSEGRYRVLNLSPEAPRSFGFVRRQGTARSYAAEQFWRFCCRHPID